MITADMICKQSVIDALAHVISEETMRACRVFWDIQMSADQQAEFANSYVLFESCVRRRYNLMTGGTL